jgi:hypothetical protein
MKVNSLDKDVNGKEEITEIEEGNIQKILLK